MKLIVAAALLIQSSLLAQDPQGQQTPRPESEQPAESISVAPAAPTPAETGGKAIVEQAKAAVPVKAPAVPALESPATPPTGSSRIAFVAENKLVAKKIYALINEIQRTGFDPQKNFSLIAELQRVITGTSFTGLAEIQNYLRASLTLNSLRSRDSKTEQGNTGTQEIVRQKTRGVKLDASLLGGPLAGADLLSNDSTKTGGAHTSGVTVSSQAAFADLGPAMQQQSAAYGKLLEELNTEGFPQPILPGELYGKWKWHSAAVAATYEFDLQQDGTLVAEVIADDPPTVPAAPGAPVVNKGRGEWKLDYRSLTLELHGTKLALFWKQPPQTFLAGKLIKSIDEDEIILDTPEDNLLKRVKTNKRR